MVFATEHEAIKYLFVEQDEVNQYSIKYVTSSEIGTYSSKDNEVIIFTSSGPKLLDLEAYGKSSKAFLSTIIREINTEKVAIEMDATINKNNLISLLEQKKLAIS